MQVNRRDWLKFAGMTLAGSCTPKKATGYPGFAVVATSGEDSLAVLDLLNFQLLSPIQLGAPPTAVINSPVPGRAYALTPASGSVHSIDAGLKVAGRRRLADQLSELHITADGSSLIAISASERKLLYADPQALTITRTLQLSGEPVSVDLDSAGSIAVATRNPDTLQIFTRSGEHRLVALPAPVGQIRFRFDGKAIIAAQLASHAISIFNAPDLQLLADLPLAMQPENLCFTTDGGQLFVTGSGMDAVAIVFPYRSLEVEQTVLAGRDPGFMACCSSPLYLFVASNSGSDLSLMDVDSRKVIGIVQVGLRPRFIAITPDNQYALIANQQSGDLAIIRIPSIRVNRGKSGVALFNLLPVGSQPVHVAVVQRV